MKVRIFSLARYIEQALRGAEYTPDADGCVAARVAGAAGFFSQGSSVEEARENLRDAIEGNVLLALQLGLPVPKIEGIEITERTIAGSQRRNGKAQASKTARSRA
jgi:predicted RNase H-like HicB family nuclease